jgi:hypothetical protein
MGAPGNGTELMEGPPLRLGYGAAYVASVINRRSG